MNVFVLDRDPAAAARALCDRHVGKMLLEAVQVLSTVAHERGEPAPYRPTHRHHPVTRWAADSEPARGWLYRHAEALAAEYRFRFGKAHASERALGSIRRPRPNRFRAPFVQCVPEAYRREDPVEAYRAYYRAEKAGFARWERGRPAPEWWAS